MQINIFRKKLFISLGFVFVVFFGFVFAQPEDSCPNYTFTGEWGFGDTNREIKVLQKFLNADPNTQVAKTGPGSPGNETEFFGNATRIALRKFQNLGRLETHGFFTGKTKDIINRMCKEVFDNKEDLAEEVTTKTTVKTNIVSGQKITPGSEPQVNTNIGSGTKLTVQLSTNAKNIKQGDSFKVSLRTNKPIKGVDATAVIIDGGAEFVNAIKLSPTSFNFTIRTNEETEKLVTVQIEADRLEALNEEVVNEESSNQIEIKVAKVGASTGANDELTEEGVEKSNSDSLFGNGLTDSLQSILDKFFGKVPGSAALAPSTDCSRITFLTYADTSHPCYGKVPFSSQQNPNDAYQKMMEAQQQAAQQKALADMLKGLGGAGGGQPQQGGGDKGGGGGGQSPGGGGGGGDTKGGGDGKGNPSDGGKAGKPGQTPAQGSGVAGAKPEMGDGMSDVTEGYKYVCDKIMCVDVDEGCKRISVPINFATNNKGIDLTSEKSLGKKGYKYTHKEFEDSEFAGKYIGKGLVKANNCKLTKGKKKLVEPKMVNKNAKTPKGEFYSVPPNWKSGIDNDI